MSDLISRRAVLAIVKDSYLDLGKFEDSRVFCAEIKALPSADVRENIHGEWIAYDHGMGLVYLECPFCGVTIDKRHAEHNFCGKCGAKLSGEKSGFER